jgi:UDP-N-acetylmuramyl pentapeptide phosphotransferase/UDP-N-acetylglucosamine-1-phosphate transferase
MSAFATLAVVAALMAFILAVLSPLLVRPALRRLGAVDVPSFRSSHSTPTLRGLGIGIALGATAALVIVGTLAQAWSLELTVVVLSGMCFALLGLTEDVVGLSIRIRAGAQVAIGVVAVAVLAPNSPVPLIVTIALVPFIAFFTNAANFMDGINGISSLNSLVFGATFVAVGFVYDLAWLVLTGASFAAAFAGFLPWNRGRKPLFLGDSGSYFIGGFVAITISAAILDGASIIALIAPVWIYLVDTVATLLTRIGKRQAWTQAHREHTYQRLMDQGRPHYSVAAFVALASGMSALFGVLTIEAGPLGTTLLILALLVFAAVYRVSPALKWEARA